MNVDVVGGNIIFRDEEDEVVVNGSSHVSNGKLGTYRMGVLLGVADKMSRIASGPVECIWGDEKFEEGAEHFEIDMGVEEMRCSVCWFENERVLRVWFGISGELSLMVDMKDEGECELRHV